MAGKGSSKGKKRRDLKTAAKDAEDTADNVVDIDIGLVRSGSDNLFKDERLKKKERK